MAKELEGKPFHLLATHCQKNSRANVIKYIKGKGLAPTSPNVTVTSFGGHPKVKGNGYVPYYMVFDQHGELAHHHMCGGYHGGDGLKMIEWVKKLLKDAPEIYLGKDPFTVIRKLAAQVAKKKKLAAAVKRIETELAGEPGRERRAELQRLHDAVKAWHDTRFDHIVKLSATNPPQVVPAMKQLAKDLKGTKLGEHSARNLSSLQKDAGLKTAIRLFKSFQKTVKAVDKLKDPSPTALKRHAKRLEKLIEGHENAPVSKTIREYIESLR